MWYWTAETLRLWGRTSDIAYLVGTLSINQWLGCRIDQVLILSRDFLLQAHRRVPPHQLAAKQQVRRMTTQGDILVM